VVTLLVGTLAVIGSVSACSHQTELSSALIDHSRGGPPPSVTASPRAANDTSPSVAWAQPDEIYVTTFGSSSCPRLPTSVKASRPHRVTVKTAQRYLHKSDTSCTADLGPTTSTIRLPGGIDATSTLIVTVDGTPVTLQPFGR
jgi:hypothetical protein